MDNINVVVLIVALVFVAVGIALIAVSAFMGRGSKDEAAGTAEATAPAPDEEEAFFIDEPLATDMASELAAKERPKKTEPGEESAVGEPAAAVAVEAIEEPVVEEPAVEAAETVDEPVAEETKPEELGEAEPAVVAVSLVPTAPTTGSDNAVYRAASGVASFDFTVQLGFKYLRNNLYGEAAAEFQKAATLTDDPGAKLHLYTEIGDAFRELGMTSPAYAAYLQATAYAQDPEVQARLERSIAEIGATDLGSVGGDGSTGSEEE